MSTEGLIMDYTISSTGSAPGVTSESPKDKVKFLCSHGGKILPRPLDAHLKYVGGETRIISAPRDIKFAELMKKLTYPIDGDMVLKYQLVTEDLDALVSVKSDEDLCHMLEEYDRNEATGAPRLRTFLFPAKPVVLENHMEIHGLEQRYIDAVNGFIRASPAGTKQRPVLHINRPSFGPSPSDTASPSPRSPESSYTDVTAAHEPPMPNNYHIHRSHMYRVQSSPSICNHNGTCFQPVYYNCYPNSRQPHYQGHLGKPPFDPYKSVGPGLFPVKSMGRVDGSRYQVDQLPPHHFMSIKHDYSSWTERRTDRGCSLPPSPLSLSPRSNTHNAMRPWDTAMAEDS